MRGVIYARYSSDNQREESIEGQILLRRLFAFLHLCGKTSQNMIRLEVILSRSVKGLKIPLA